MDNAGLLVNLAFALAAALVGGLLAARLRQSVVLGYILAGVVIGPFTPGFVGDVAAVQVLADIGVILLMFAIGVQFSFRDLLRVGRIATLGALVQVVITIAVGYLVGLALGWPSIEALFFGAVLSNSSSTVLSKVLGERGEMGTEHGRIGLAWSSVQDLSTIVLVVVLSALAAGGETLWTDLLWSLGKAVLFLALLVPLGTVVLPWVFERVATMRNRELFVVLIGVVALNTAFISSLFGLSLALGAFVAGVAVGESDLSHQILGEVMPLRDIFAGLFFVSVGMLVDPLFVAENLGLVLLTLALIIVFKGTLSAVITALFGYSARTAVLTGVTLAQSAEFSFLMARVGVEVGAVSSAVFSLMLAGAAASILLAPSLHQGAQPLASWLERRMWQRARVTAPPPTESLPRGHAAICGYGDVGRMIGAVLRQRGFPFVVVEEDPRRARLAREEGIHTLLGSASNPALLELLNLTQARVLIVTIGDPLATRQIVDYARRANPDLDIVARAHSTVEAEYLLRRGVSEAARDELEVALELTRHTLRRFGVSALESLAVVQRLRERLELERDDSALG